jgi:RNA polymerase sigma-70 factor (ECF subfamily)
VFRFAFYLSGNRAEAEDITSDTFVRVWSAPGPIEQSTVKGYLFAIARNLFLQRLRPRSRLQPLEDSLSDPRPGPEVIAANRVAYSEVLARLQLLPEVDRAVLLMSAFDGIPYADIAKALEISVPAVKMKIHRARLALSRVEESK